MNYNILQNCLLFKNKSTDEIQYLLSQINYKIENYTEKKIIVSEQCSEKKIGIVLCGTIEIEKLFSCGKTVTLNRLIKSDVFGIASLFSKHKVYPATVVSLKSCEILFIYAQDMINLLSLDTDVLNEFLKFSCNSTFNLIKKIEILSLGSIRKKIVQFLIGQSKIQKSSIHIRLPFSKRVWAEYMNINRPSLYRELKKMTEENLLIVKGKIIELKDITKLENILFN